MENVLIKKGLIFGTVIMFITICIVPTNADISTNGRQDKYQISNCLQENRLGNITAIWNVSNPFKPQIIFDSPDPEDRNFSFPIVGGKSKVNFSVMCRGWIDTFAFLPRIILFQFGVWDEEDNNKLILYKFKFVIIWGYEPVEKLLQGESIELTVSVNETKLLGIWFQARGSTVRESTGFYVWAHFE